MSAASVSTKRIAGDAPGSTFEDHGAELLEVEPGRFVVHHWTRMQGEPGSYEEVSEWGAAWWAVVAGYVEEATARFGEPVVRDAVKTARHYGIDTVIPKQAWE